MSPLSLMTSLALFAGGWVLEVPSPVKILLQRCLSSSLVPAALKGAFGFMSTHGDDVSCFHPALERVCTKVVNRQ